MNALATTTNMATLILPHIEWWQYFYIVPIALVLMYIGGRTLLALMTLGISDLIFLTEKK